MKGLTRKRKIRSTNKTRTYRNKKRNTRKGIIRNRRTKRGGGGFFNRVKTPRVMGSTSTGSTSTGSTFGIGRKSSAQTAERDNFVNNMQKFNWTDDNAINTATTLIGDANTWLINNGGSKTLTKELRLFVNEKNQHIWKSSVNTVTTNISTAVKSGTDVVSNGATAVSNGATAVSNGATAVSNGVNNVATAVTNWTVPVVKFAQRMNRLLKAIEGIPLLSGQINKQGANAKEIEAAGEGGQLQMEVDKPPAPSNDGTHNL
jgi:hypothetical protein